MAEEELLLCSKNIKHTLDVYRSDNHFLSSVAGEKKKKSFQTLVKVKAKLSKRASQMLEEKKLQSTFSESWQLVGI